MIAHNEDGQATEVTLPGGGTPCRASTTAPEGSDPRPLGATPPYTDENDPTDEEALPLSYDERRDWYSKGQYSADCAPDVPASVGQPDHGYFVDSELDTLEPLDLSLPAEIPDDEPIPQMDTRYLSLPNELVPEVGRCTPR